MWHCKRNNIEVFWEYKDNWDKRQLSGKQFPVCNKWNNGRCLEDKKPCEKGGKHNIEKIADSTKLSDENP